MDEKYDAFLSKFVHFETLIAQIPALPAWMSRMDSRSSKTFWDFAIGLTEMEQNFSALTARMCKFETYAASASNVSGSARYWPTFEQVDGSAAALSHGPGSSDDNRNTRRRLDPSSSAEDEQLRSAVLFRFPFEQNFKGITKWIDTLWEESDVLACNKAARIHCKAGSVSVRLVFETRGKFQDFVVRYKDDGIQCAIDSPFCCTNTTITVRQARSMEDREIGKQFVPRWKELADQLKVLFPDADDEGVFIIFALDARSQILSFKDRRNGIGKPVFKLAPLGNGQTFTLVTLDLSVLGISPKELQRVLSLKPTGLMCDGRSFGSALFRRLAGRGFFCLFLVWWVLHFAFSLIRGVAMHESSSCCREDALGDCGRPCDPLSCLLFIALLLQSIQSIVVQETPSAKDIDLTCSRTFLFNDATCFPVEPMSLDWLLDLSARFDLSCSSFSLGVPSDEQQRGDLPASTRSRWRQGCSSNTTADFAAYCRLGWMCSLPFRRHTVYYLEHQRSRWIDVFQTEEQRVQTQISQETL